MRACLLSLVAVINAAPARRVFAWTHKDEEESAAQIAEQHPLFDGIFVGFCGLHIEGNASRPTLRVGPYYESDRCRVITSKVQELGLELHMWVDVQQSRNFLRGDGPHDMSELVATIAAEAKRRNWTGIQIDDESETCPRRDRDAMRYWIQQMNRLAEGLHEHQLQLTAAVQSLSCTSCSPWPACLKASDGHDLAWYQELSQLLISSPVDRWLEMDTYYSTLPYFYDNLDFYNKEMFGGHPERWGAGVLPNANPTDDDQTLARFHAFETSGVLEIDVFKLPLKPNKAMRYYTQLHKWKRGRADCGTSGVLSYWEQDEPCGSHGQRMQTLVRRLRGRP